MQLNQKISEGLTLLDSYAPIATAASTVTTANWIYAGNMQALMALIQTGLMGASATLDAKIRQASDSSGTGAKDVTGKAIVQILKAAGDSVQALINFRPQDLDQANGFTYVQVSMTVGTASSVIAATLFGMPRFETADAKNAAGVVQII